MKFFISAGDPSGDIHTAKLMAELKRISPDIEFIGIGGNKMIEQGLSSIVPLSKMSVVGFWEVAKKYSFFKKVMKQCINILKDENIDAFIPVDYPGFNIRLAENAKILNIPVIYYIAPQLWAWGKNRALKISNCTDLLLVVFPFELEFFHNYNINTKFVGHPLLDDNNFREDFLKYHEREKILALLPGSRQQEIITHIPIMTEIAKIFIKKNQDFKIAIALSNSSNMDYVYNYLKKNNLNFELHDNSNLLMKKALLGIVKTGTSNLESALLGMPFTMLYKTSFLSYLIGKKLVNMPYISLVNILSEKPVITEYIQKFDYYQVAEKLNSIAHDIELYNNYQEAFYNIKRKLGTAGASAKAASEIINQLKL